MEYNAARNLLPLDAVWSSSFGYCSDGGYSEYWRTPDGRRFQINNGASYLDSAPFCWSCIPLAPLPAYLE